MKDLQFEKVAGLNVWAATLVADFVLAYLETTIRAYPDGREEQDGPLPVFRSHTKKEVYSSYAGAYGDSVPLHKYTLRDGREYWEVEQKDIPWSSRPIVFLALRGADGVLVPESLWSEETAQHILAA
jgi:hypothetical protein